MSSQRKAVAIACFAIRALYEPSLLSKELAKQYCRVVGAIIAQLVLLMQQRNSKDATLDTWSYYLAVQFVQSLSVITACIPYIKNVLLGVESGMFQTGHFGLATLHKSPQRLLEYDSSAAASGKGIVRGSSALCSHESSDQISPEVVVARSAQIGPVSVEKAATAKSVTPGGECDEDSQSSRANIIRETREWHVDYET